MSSLGDVVKSICPGFPTDRWVKPTMDRKRWYMIDHAEKTLWVPTVKYLQMNTHELDSFIESVNAFSTMNFNSNIYDWELHRFIITDNMDVATQLSLLKDYHSLFVSYREVACDIETRHIHWEDNKILAIGFGWDNNHALAVVSEREIVWRKIQEILHDYRITFIWHNGKFDVTRLEYIAGIFARVDEDTLLMHYAQINSRRGTHSLKDLGRLYLQAPAWEDELQRVKKEWCKKNKKKLADFKYDDLPLNVLIPYLQNDVIATLRLYQVFGKMTRDGSDFIYNKLIEGSEVYGDISLAGVMVDMEYLEELEYVLDMEIAKATKHFYEVVERIWDPMKYVEDTGARSIPKEFNINSPKQLKWMLENALEVKIDSTDAATIDVLATQAEKGEFGDHVGTEFIRSVSELRSLGKYQDTYVQGYRKEMCRDFRLRCDFNLHGTETGRLSASNPNLQNVPRNPRIKKLLRAAPGYKLLQLDYSQAELRVLAHLSNDAFMKQVYIDGKDLHSQVAAEMFGEDFTKEDRNLAKTINFGIAYGRGPLSIADAFDLPFHEAVQMIQNWFKPMPNVKKYIEQRRGMAMKGEQCVTPFGRERSFVVTGENLYHVENEYINTPIQSIASDLTMFSVIEIHRTLREKNIKARVILSVHDSIILEIPDNEFLITRVAEECATIMKEVPQKYLHTTVPFEVDAEVGYNWGVLEEWPLNSSTKAV